MKRILFVSAILLFHTFSFAQHTVKATKAKAKKPAPSIIKLNEPRGIVTNNYSYYNTERGGYVFYDNGRESFLPALPIAPETKMMRTSVPLGKKLDLDLYPQRHYPNNKLVHPDQNTN